MSSSVSSDNIHKMDAILYDELKHLEEGKKNLMVYAHKENNQHLSSSADLYNRTSSILHHSRRSSNTGDRSPRVTFKDAKQGHNDWKTDPNIKMQKEILNLQNKVLELELKFANITSPTYDNPSKKNSINLTNAIDENKRDYLSRNPSIRRGESEFRSSQIVIMEKPTRNTLRVSPILHQDHLEFSQSPDGLSKILMRTPSGISTQATSKSTARKTLKRECNLRSGLRVSTENYSSISKNSSSSSLRNKSTKSRIYQDGEDQIFQLHTQIKKFKQEYSSDKAELIKERIKGKELDQEVGKLMKTMEKLELSLQNASKIQNGYAHLMESFGKSENIRRQQRDMIESLNTELKLIRGEDEDSKSEILYKSKSNMIGSAQKKIKSKKKVTKLF